MTDTTTDITNIVDARWLEPARRRKAFAITSIALLAALLIAFLHPDSMAQNALAFGDIASRFGLPLRFVVTLLVCAAYIPIPYALWHLFGLVLMGAAEGRSIGKFGLISSIFTVPSRHPELKFSRAVVLFILGGYILAMFAFAYTADEKDIERARKSQKIQTGANPQVSFESGVDG